MTKIISIIITKTLVEVMVNGTNKNLVFALPLNQKALVQLWNFLFKIAYPNDNTPLPGWTDSHDFSDLRKRYCENSNYLTKKEFIEVLDVYWGSHFIFNILEKNLEK